MSTDRTIDKFGSIDSNAHIKLAAQEYFECRWDGTHLLEQQRRNCHLGNEVNRILVAKEDAGEMEQHQIDDIKHWRLSNKQILKDGEKELKELWSREKKLKIRYEEECEAAGIDSFVPYYTIDSTESEMRHKIQRFYDVERDLAHILPPPLDESRLAGYRSARGRIYYENSPKLNDELSLAAELTDLREYKEDVLKVLPWLPQSIATMAGLRRDGRELGVAGVEQYKKIQKKKFRQTVEDYLGVPLVPPKSPNPPPPKPVRPSTYVMVPKPTTPSAPAYPVAPPNPNSTQVSNRYHRPGDKYVPTYQLNGHRRFRTHRGNPPGAITDRAWTSLFDSANDKVLKRHPTHLRCEMARVARESGETRDMALDVAIQRNWLPTNFQDLHP